MSIIFKCTADRICCYGCSTWQRYVLPAAIACRLSRDIKRQLVSRLRFIKGAVPVGDKFRHFSQDVVVVVIKTRAAPLSATRSVETNPMMSCWSTMKGVGRSSARHLVTSKVL